MFLKRILKNIFCFFRNFLPPQKGASVLMYHSIGNNNYFLSVKPKNFEKQMTYLKEKNFNVISLTELVDLLILQKTIPFKTVVLTFDDGYEDNYLKAWPILKKLQLPATIFLATDKIEAQAMLKWKQIKEMHESGLIDFQPHTASHPKLNQIKPKEAEKEILKSKEVIEEKLDKECFFFAYPKGRFNEEVIEVVKKLGFRAALSTISGRVNLKDDLFTLKRNSVSLATSFCQFKTKALSYIPKLKK